MISTITRFSRSSHPWILLLLLALVLQGFALYYQYALNYGPCVLCIHVRMLVFALIPVALAMILLNRFTFARFTGFALTTAVFIWLTERSWQLLATERGWVLGSCDMRSGLPEWLPLEAWLPSLFTIEEPCGYTPAGSRRGN